MFKAIQEFKNFNYTAKYTYAVCYQAVYTGHEHIQVGGNLHGE